MYGISYIVAASFFFSKIRIKESIFAMSSAYANNKWHYLIEYIVTILSLSSITYRYFITVRGFVDIPFTLWSNVMNKRKFPDKNAIFHMKCRILKTLRLIEKHWDGLATTIRETISHDDKMEPVNSRTKACDAELWWFTRSAPE